MRLNKNLLKGLTFLLITIAILGSIFYFSWDIKRVWDDENSWNWESILDYSDDIRFTKTREISANETEYVIPYCTLYNATQGDSSSSVKYSCSLKPYYQVGISKVITNYQKLLPDITFTYTKGDPLPSKFLNRVGIDQESIFSIGSEPTPVSMTITLSDKFPKATFSNTLLHYIRYRVSNVKETVAEKVVSWSITPIMTQKPIDVDEAKQWAKNNVDNFVFEYNNEKIAQLTGASLLNNLKVSFQYQEFDCSPYGMLCDFAEATNPAANIILYSYVLNNLGDKTADHIKTNLDSYATPFAKKKNPNFTVKVPDCANDPSYVGECKVDYSDLQAYTFPVCPIRDLREGKLTSKNVQLFKDYMYKYYKNGDPKQTATQIAKSLAALKAEVDALKIDMQQVNPLSVEGVDLNCYNLVYYGIKDKTQIDSLISSYYTLLSKRFGIFEADGKITYLTDETVLRRLLQRSRLQGTEYTYVPDELKEYSILDKSITDKIDKIESKNFTASIPLTLLALYLYE